MLILYSNLDNLVKQVQFTSLPMATMEVETQQPTSASFDTCSAKQATKQGEGLRQYYLQHIHELQLQVRQKTHNLNRLEAQRNELNSKGTNQF